MSAVDPGLADRGRPGFEADAATRLRDAPAPILTTAHLKKLGFTLQQAPLGLVTLDPSGGGSDYAAITVAEREEWQRFERSDPEFEVQTILRFSHLERQPRDDEFPDTIAKLLALHRACVQRGNANHLTDHRFLIEKNGVGWPFYSELLRKIGPRRVIGITTVGADDSILPWAQGTGWRMPRLPGLAYFREALERDRIKFQKDAPGVALFLEEMRQFGWRGSRGRRPEAREGGNDDLVMAAAITAWAAWKIIPPIVKAARRDLILRSDGTTIVLPGLPSRPS